MQRATDYIFEQLEENTQKEISDEEIDYITKDYKGWDEDFAIGLKVGAKWYRNQLKERKIIKKIKTFLILPLISYSRLEDGKKEICIGWFRKTYTIIF